jgi:hypothetical protein
MGFAERMVRAVSRALCEAKTALRSVCVSVAAHVFVGIAVDRLMPGKLFADMEILDAFVGHEGRLAADFSTISGRGGPSSHHLLSLSSHHHRGLGRWLWDGSALEMMQLTYRFRSASLRRGRLGYNVESPLKNEAVRAAAWTVAPRRRKYACGFLCAGD